MGIFQEDKILLAFLLVLNLISQEIKIDETQLKFITRGPGKTSEQLN
jgi:hypothetical protein